MPSPIAEKKYKRFKVQTAREGRALALIVAAPIGACAVLITRLDTGALDPGYLQWVTRLADPFIPG